MRHALHGERMLGTDGAHFALQGEVILCFFRYDRLTSSASGSLGLILARRQFHAYLPLIFCRPQAALSERGAHHSPGPQRRQCQGCGCNREYAVRRQPTHEKHLITDVRAHGRLDRHIDGQEPACLDQGHDGQAGCA